ncbi:hypothetical protein E3N88_44621 [Mikania micrantha]|uniref:Uncharacterized protein n=1 Tax=Mikania micrantha TaxID=192012 RepID=A0A5N6LBS9_9ASTR|nr:hypothetical protein E3N88_44621 [Mikania micrantha]
MGKEGPCYHCGVASTPLWRNGPPEKPVLCNACGSRWRTKGTLANYTPLHARSEPDAFEDHRVSKVKAISIKNNKAKLLKRKDKHENVVGGSSGGMLGGGFASSHHRPYLFKGLDEDTSNRSSSGSALSNSDSCLQLGSADYSDLTGPSQSSVMWDSMLPSRKRTCVNQSKQSPVEKLTRDLCTILHEQQSYFSGSSEDDLIFESDTPMVSVEIGHGSMLIRHPNSTAREDESEASSLSVDTKSEVHSWLTSRPSYNVNNSGKFLSQKLQESKINNDQDQNNRDNDEKLSILVNHNSPLCKIDLKDIINFEEFASRMTKDEQQQLVKYVPPIDTLQLPDSLKNMFDSPQFKENLVSFQILVAQGNFDLSAAEMKSEGCKTLKKLALNNMTKCKWVEQYNMIQDANYKKDSKVGVANAIAPSSSVNAQRLNHLLSFPDESCEHDVLLDVPSNTSFPQAELLPTSSFVVQSSRNI